MSRDAKAVPTRVPAVPSVEPDNRAPIGLRVKGRYRVISELGTGVFGTVCLAVDETDGHEIAIRFLPRELGDLSQPTHIKRRADPSIVEASKAHPALVRVLEFGEAENGQAFVAMDLVHGRRLSAILSEGSLEFDTALRVAIELGGAVESLHNIGLVHGALRPSNVMIGSDGRVTLLDVELIGVRAAQAVNGIMIDEPPPEYLSPEQIRQVLVTETTDIYVFAVILYELLCGVPPFQGETREAVLAKHLTETPVPMRRRRRTVPASVEAVVALALSKVPEPRPPIQTILNRLWEEANRPAPPPVVEQAPIPAPSSSIASPARTEASPGKATPAIVPSSAARSTPPSAPPLTSPPSRMERQEQRRVPKTPEGPVSERPAASSNTDDPDPSAIIDWILEQRAAARRGQ
jgi:serine/threonine protein kinase